MKIHLKGRPKPLVLIKVTCLDSIMSLMLSCVPDAPVVISEEQITDYRLKRIPLPVIHQFLHGAYLMVGDAKNEYFIQAHLGDGSDGSAAIEELKMYDALRTARKHFLAMKKACYHPAYENYGLRVTRF